VRRSRKPKGRVSVTSTPPDYVIYDSEVVGFGCKDLRVETIPSWLARLVISGKHYSRRFVNNSYLHLGVFAEREFVGVLQFGYALNPSSGKNVVEGTGNREYMELNRMWVHDRMPRNTESRVLSYSVKLIRRIHPQVQWIQSFADERCGGAGGVYQAASFDFIGWHYTEFYELDGDTYHPLLLTAHKKGGGRGQYLRDNIGRATCHKLKQFRYIRFLKKSARRRLNGKRFKILPYPKPGR